MSAITASRDYLRWVLAVNGAISAIVGLLILIWPEKTAVIATALVAVYALLSGVLYVVLGAVIRGLTTTSRVVQILLGVLLVISAIVAFANLGVTTVFLAIIVVVFVGASWIFQGIAALLTLDSFTVAGRPGTARGWTIAFAIISILAGIALLLSPLFAAVWIWLFLGISLVVFGITQFVQALRSRSEF